MINLAWWHKKRIQKLYRERYSLQELYIMYKGIIPFNQLRDITKNVERYERI